MLKVIRDDVSMIGLLNLVKCCKFYPICINSHTRYAPIFQVPNEVERRKGHDIYSLQNGTHITR